MAWLELEGAHILPLALAVLSGALLLALLAVCSVQALRRSGRARAAEAQDLRATMARLEGELIQLGRDMNGRIDAKVQALRLLLQEAGETIEQLRRLRHPRSSAGTKDRLRPEPAGVHASAGAGQSGTPQQAASAPRSATQTRPVRSSGPELPDLRAQRYAHVYSLADSGQDAAQISAETGMHRGEVELVLSLRRKKFRLDRGNRSEPARGSIPPEEAEV